MQDDSEIRKTKIVGYIAVIGLSAVLIDILVNFVNWVIGFAY